MIIPPWNLWVAHPFTNAYTSERSLSGLGVQIPQLNGMSINAKLGLTFKFIGVITFVCSITVIIIWSWFMITVILYSFCNLIKNYKQGCHCQITRKWSQHIPTLFTMMIIRFNRLLLLINTTIQYYVILLWSIMVPVGRATHHFSWDRNSNSMIWN